MPSQQTGSATSYENYQVAISLSTPSISGYIFSGWCSSSTVSTFCSSTSYGSGESWTVPSDGATLELYAMWRIDQGSCPRTITACTPGNYPGKRFGNGKCWMYKSYNSSVTLANANCPDGWSMPTRTDFENLISSAQAGNGNCLNEQGWSYAYWHSKSSNSSYSNYCSFSVFSNTAYFSSVKCNDDTAKAHLICVSI